MRAKFLSISLLAAMFALLADCVVANALTVTETESFNFSTAQVTFNVTTDGNGNVSTTPDPLSQAVTTDFRDLTFNRFNTALGTLTAVTITLTSDYDVTVTVSATTTSPDEVTFFAETTSPFGHTLTGSGLISALTSTLPSQPFSASCVVNAPPDDDDMCNSGSQISNNNVFNGTASLAAMLASFSGSGTYNLTATLSSALAPRVDPDNETDGGFADNSTFDGTLDHNWAGNVKVEYTYDPFTTPVPEPLSLYLLAAGLGGIALSRRRRP